MTTTEHPAFRSRLLVAASLVATLGVCAPTLAADPPEKLLFEEGKSLMASGRAAEACPKFEQALALQHGIGVQFHLAKCYEAIGRLASAHRNFSEVQQAAMVAGQADRAKLAGAEADRLKPRLSTITLHVPAVANITVVLDGQAVGAGNYGQPIHADGGEHDIAASAPGHVGWSWRLSLGAEQDHQEVRVPVLASANQPPPSTTTTVTTTDEDTTGGPPWLAIAGWSGIGLGAVGIGVSLGLSIAAKSTYDESDAHCPAGGCSQEGLALVDDAQAMGNMATGFFVAGAVLAAAGVALVITDAATGEEEGHAVFSVKATAAGLDATWRF